ncbi:hypothetical protein L3Q82_007943 [Scortum barcoo]|uniref:Uncharacterized protein n=1 Tax=Scortum barcoo TaxID=214431 RepID=A0ACB8WJS8_9TELE|nr:hypothetical protein L3Q82_007943 [Scortum barcoo]
MDEYSEALLRSSIMRPSSSPAGAGFFFVGKEDGSLRPCNDYSSLNDINMSDDKLTYRNVDENRCFKLSQLKANTLVLAFTWQADKGGDIFYVYPKTNSVFYHITNLTLNHSGSYWATVFMASGLAKESNKVELIVQEKNTSTTVPPTTNDITINKGSGSPRVFSSYIVTVLAVSPVVLLVALLPWFIWCLVRTKGLIGMNVVKKCRELVNAEFDTTLQGGLDSRWWEAFHRLHAVTVTDRLAFARVAGKDVVHVPASSAVTVMARGLRNVSSVGPPLLLEPISTPLPGGLIVVPTLVSSGSHLFPVRVMNLSDEDVWLRPRTRLGVLTHIDSVESEERCKVQFQRISATTEQVSIDQRPDTTTDVRSIIDKLTVGGTPEQKSQLAVLLEKYSFVFATEDEDLGYADKVQHEIHLTDDVPVTQPYRRIPPTQYSEVREHIAQKEFGTPDT